MTILYVIHGICNVTTKSTIRRKVYFLPFCFQGGGVLFSANGTLKSDVMFVPGLGIKRLHILSLYIETTMRTSLS